MRLSRSIPLLALLAAGPLAAPPKMSAAPAQTRLPFIENDYSSALAKARARGVPIFVEAWAPWCHTCRSMQAFVLTDPSLAKRADQFVWLAIDTERAENAPFKQKYPIDALPTFFVLDAKSESAALRWVGGASVAQLQKILDDGRRGVGGASGSAGGIEELLDRADRLYAKNDNARAAALYGQALERAPAGWPKYGRALESLLFALDASGDPERCARAALAAYPRLRKKPSAANVAGSGLGCALSVPADRAGRGDLVSALRSDALDVLAAPRPDIAADDLSGLYQALEEERERAGDAAERTALLERHAAFLEKEAARARTPAGRAVFDSHRLGAYLDLGQPQRAIPMLEQSERDFPGDYNPPARLASAYRAMKKWDDAAAASDRALAKGYGPRKIGILQVRADIEAGRGDTTASRRALEEALRIAEAMPEGQRSDRTIAALKKKLEGS
ncbi:MAG: thioredoxin family protein [Acidobacteriota bacterium]